MLQTGWDTSTHSDVFKKVVNKVFDTTDREYIKEWKEVYKAKKMTDLFERDTQMAGFEAASELAESEGIGLQDPVRGADKTYTVKRYGTAFRVSDLMKRTNKWDLVPKLTRNLSNMQNYCKETKAAEVWNDPTGATYTYKGFDTLDLAESAHTGLLGASTADNYNNYGDVDLSHAAIAAAEQYFDNMIDDMGHVMPMSPDKLVVAPELRHTAAEIYRSDKKSGEMSNTANVLNKGVSTFVYHFLTSSTAWYLLAKNHDLYDMKMWTLAEPDIKVEDAADNSRDTIISSQQYFVSGFGDPRAIYAGNG